MVSRVEAQASVESEPADAPPGYAEAISEAVEHYSAGRWRRAQEAFARAHTLQPSARTLRGLGLANFYLENFATAREAFEQALSDTRKPLPDTQRTEVAELLRSCERETGRFELRVAPPSARVELDGEPTERRVLVLDRGDHVVAVSAEGHASERIVLHVTGAEDRALEVALTAHTVAPPPVAEAPAPAPIDEYSGYEPAARGDRVFTWVAAAAAPAFAGVALAVWLTGQGEHDEITRECKRDGCDEAEADRRFEAAGGDAYETWTNVSLVAAGVSLAAAVVLFVVEGEGSGSEIAISAKGPGATLSARF